MIVLNEYATPKRLVRSGHENGIVVTAGKRFVIETSPGGADVLDVECPAGKQWSVRIIMEITETDA